MTPDELAAIRARDALVDSLGLTLTEAECDRRALLREVDRLFTELEIERLRLAACGVAATANTPETAAEQRLKPDSPYLSASYHDVCAAVEREMALRDWQRRALEPMRRRVARCNLCAGRGYVFNTTDPCPACAADRALIEEAQR